MKFNLYSIALYIIAVAALVSCNKDDNTPSIDEPDAEYTIIAYGCAGGDLDHDIYLNFLEVEAMGYQEDVQFTAMFKYSKDWQEAYEECEGTRLLTMEPNGEMSNTRVGDVDLRLDEPQTLADFIIDAKRRLPAKKYILVLNNHGGAFNISDQPVEASYEGTKNIVQDDNTDYSSISIFEFEAALELVGERLDMLYWDACLMNAIENNYQIYEYFDYIMGSNHSSWNSDYSLLVNSLLKYDNIVESGQYYTEKLIDSWIDLDVSASCDLTLIDCAKIERVVELIGDGCDILCDLRDGIVEGSYNDYVYKYYNGSSSDAAREYYLSDEYNANNPEYNYTEGGMHYFYSESFAQIDICRTFRYFSMLYALGDLAVTTTLLNDALEEMYLSRVNLNLSEKLSNISVSVKWISDVNYNYNYSAINGFEINNYSELYPLLDFDRATGWGSRFLSGNVVQAVGLDPESGEYYNIERE